jgi:cytochrome c-type biogenesis protein CcmE
VLAVEYRDALPDTFHPGGPVQVDGEYFAAGKIRADHVFTKCPSKYEAGEKGMKSEPGDAKDLKTNVKGTREAQSPSVPAKPSL